MSQNKDTRERGRGGCELGGRETDEVQQQSQGSHFLFIKFKDLCSEFQGLKVAMFGKFKHCRGLICNFKNCQVKKMVIHLENVDRTDSI